MDGLIRDIDHSMKDGRPTSWRLYAATTLTDMRDAADPGYYARKAGEIPEATEEQTIKHLEDKFGKKKIDAIVNHPDFQHELGQAEGKTGMEKFKKALTRARENYENYEPDAIDRQANLTVRDLEKEIPAFAIDHKAKVQNELIARLKEKEQHRMDRISKRPTQAPAPGREAVGVEEKRALSQTPARPSAAQPSSRFEPAAPGAAPDANRMPTAAAPAALREPPHGGNPAINTIVARPAGEAPQGAGLGVKAAERGANIGKLGTLMNLLKLGRKFIPVIGAGMALASAKEALAEGRPMEAAIRLSAGITRGPGTILEPVVRDIAGRAGANVDSGAPQQIILTKDQNAFFDFAGKLPSRRDGLTGEAAKLATLNGDRLAAQQEMDKPGGNSYAARTALEVAEGKLGSAIEALDDKGKQAVLAEIDHSRSQPLPAQDSAQQQDGLTPPPRDNGRPSTLRVTQSGEINAPHAEIKKPAAQQNKIAINIVKKQVAPGLV